MRSDDVSGTMKPFSVTNPIWVDVDGDGQITPSHNVIPQDCQNFQRVDRANSYLEVPVMNCACVLGARAPGC
jgi:hypothetical protein